MSTERTANISVANHIIFSAFLERAVTVDFYLPTNISNPEELSLLLINDGQDLVNMPFDEMLEELYDTNSIRSLLCVGIYCGKDRKNEYGTARFLDYKGRGARAGLYTSFIFNELIPFIHKSLMIDSFKEKSFAGFSLGGLSALDIVLNNPLEFARVGVFSGSLWWRDKDQDDPDFSEDTDMIMRRQVRESKYYPWLKFFFEVGTLDETADRNNNGIIDSIDDTQGVIDHLVEKGYENDKDIKFLELKDGRHDVPTWAMAMPGFLIWGWGAEG